MAFTKIDASKPAGTDKKKFGDDEIRNLKQQTIDNLKEIANYPASTKPALRTAVWTTATRPAGEELVERVSGYNTDTNSFEYYDNAIWKHIGASIQSLNLWKPGYEYKIGDVCYSLGSNRKRFECVTAGKTGTKEPDWPAIGQYIADNTARWIVDDVHDGRLPGDIRFPALFVRAGEIKMAGQLLNRVDVSRLVKLATDNGLIVSEEAWVGGMHGFFGEGDGSTTIRIPDLRGEFIRVWDDGRGVDDAGRTFGSAQGDAIRDFQWSFGAHNGSEDMGHLNPVDGVPNPIEYVRSNYRMSGDGKGWYQVGVRWRIGAALPVANENRPRNVALLACIKY